MPILLSSEQFVSHEFPNPPYLVNPVMPQGGSVLMFGKPGVGKTQMTLTLAQAINSGTEWLGWQCAQGAVAVAQADMTGQIQQERIARVCKDVNLSDTHWVVEEDGSAPYLNVMTMMKIQQQLVDELRALDPLLMVWDTLRKVNTLPENASESAVAVYQAVHEILPSATHLFLGHTRKASRDPDAFGHEDESFMGNQQWKGSADAICSLETIDDTAIPRRLALTFHKARTASDLEKRPVMVELDMRTVLLAPVNINS